MDLFRDDAPFVERDVMAGIRALLNGPDEAQPSLPKAGEIEAMLREAKHAARRQMNGHLEVGEDALKKRREQLLASGLGNILDHVGLGADVRWVAVERILRLLEVVDEGIEVAYNELEERAERGFEEAYEAHVKTQLSKAIADGGGLVD